MEVAMEVVRAAAVRWREGGVTEAEGGGRRRRRWWRRSGEVERGGGDGGGETAGGEGEATVVRGR